MHGKKSDQRAGVFILYVLNPGHTKCSIPAELLEAGLLVLGALGRPSRQHGPEQESFFSRRKQAALETETQNTNASF